MIDLKVMLVEDDDILRERLGRILKREVRELCSCALPSEAIAEAQRFIPEVIVTDIKMPGMSGFDMVRIIRQSFPEIPVIVASAFSQPDYFINAIQLKVEHFIVKPVDVEELLATLRHIEEQLALREKLEEQSSLLKQYQHIVDTSTNITMTDPRGVITHTNDRFCELSGYTKEELIGHPHSIVRHPDVPDSFFKELWRTIRAKNVWQGIIKNRRKDGSTFYVDTTIAPVLNGRQEITEYISIKYDITDLILSKQQLQHDVITDQLTGLPNRIGLQELLQRSESCALLLIDIDHFKEINMLFGIRFGDAALMYMADSIRTTLGTTAGTACRIASDEFCILYPEQEAKGLEAFAYALKKQIEEAPFEFEGVGFALDFTGAILVDAGKVSNPIELMQGTMAEAKRNKQFLFTHDSGLHDRREYEENFLWTQKVKQALQEARITVYFQPIYNLSSKRITKYETLVRLIDEDGSVVLPGNFLKAAKRSRHYRELTRSVISDACKTFAQRHDKVSVNLSIQDITDPETLEYLIAAVEAHGLQERLIVEILESEGIDNFDVIQSVFRRLDAAGITIAIDDFGSGYSNYAYLVNLPVKLLKIDGSIIQALPGDNSARVILQSIVLFAHQLGIQCVAEFVSDPRIFEIIQALELDFAQGYHIGLPAPELCEHPAFEGLS